MISRIHKETDLPGVPAKAPFLRATPSELQVGIHDEADPLRFASVWGPVGAEVVLAQCFPPHLSLFYASFDGVAARREGLNYANTLRNHGIRVVMARDILAEAARWQPLTKDGLISALIEKAAKTQDIFGTHVKGFAESITELVEQDIQRYGEETALSLNKSLSLDPKLPLGNSLYGRDQMNVLLDNRIISRMARPIRQPEVPLYETVYGRCLPPHKTITIPEGETFEGGDAYIHNGTVFVGVGARTTLGAAIRIYQALKPQLDAHGLKFAVVEDEGYRQRSFGEQQDSMHLDTFSNPIGRRGIAVCLEEARRRKIRFLTTRDGKVVLNDIYGTFLNFLERTEAEIVQIPTEEQKGFGCNFLLAGEVDGKSTVLVPSRDNTDTNNQLERLGVQVVHTDLKESTKGYGAAHCMTGQLYRSRT